jgi:hypothetical protein
MRIGENGKLALLLNEGNERLKRWEEKEIRLWMVSGVGIL